LQDTDVTMPTHRPLRAANKKIRAKVDIAFAAPFT